MRAVFLDLNGTVVLPLKQDSLDELTLIPGAAKAISRLLSSGFVCPVVTVQARIEKGLFTEEEFREWFARFFTGLHLDLKGPYVCPHRYNYRCPCEKPNSYLYDQAASELSIDLNHSYAIGDSPQDVEAAHRFGGLGCLVKTGWAADPRFLDQARSHAAFVGDTITEAVDWILAREGTLANAPTPSEA